MGVAEAVDKVLGPKVKPEKDIMERMDRGRAAMQDGAPKRTECLEFWRGEQYKYVNSDNRLVGLPTVTNADGTGKPRHRVRTKRNILVDIVAHEISAGTSKVPGYEVLPTSASQEIVSAARLSQRVANYGYEQWNVARATEETLTYAVVADEGYAWPYFDTSIGPFIKDPETGKTTGIGEIRIKVFGGNEVMWEPGMKFEESRWFGIELAMDPKDVMAMEGYMGGNLKLDATAGPTSGTNTAEAKLVMVSHYFERPSTKHIGGRWFTFANKKVIVEERNYPTENVEGLVEDRPVLHKLSVFVDPDNDRDHGIVRHLLDAMRTINDCTNKQLEWKNLALAPQVIVENGEFRETITDEPGAVYHFRGTGTVSFREVPAIPGELSQLKEEAKGDIAQIAAQNDIPSQVESGKGIQTLIERDANRRQSFLANLARFHSGLMRSCLGLVQRYYTEDRLLQVRGNAGWEPIEDFRGAQLKGQLDVRVLPGSLEPQTRAAAEEKIMTYAQAGWISPETAMAAVNAGTADGLVQTYERDKARANLIIQRIKGGPEALFAMPMRVEPDGTEVPGWSPRRFDNLEVHCTVLEDWMKTDEFDSLAPEMQVAAMDYYNGLEQLKQQRAAEEAAAQTNYAESLGMQNAAKPQVATETADQASDQQQEAKSQHQG